MNPARKRWYQLAEMLLYFVVYRLAILCMIIIRTRTSILFSQQENRLCVKQVCGYLPVKISQKGMLSKKERYTQIFYLLSKWIQKLLNRLLRAVRAELLLISHWVSTSPINYSANESFIKSFIPVVLDFESCN